MNICNIVKNNALYNVKYKNKLISKIISIMFYYLINYEFINIKCIYV